MNNVYYGVIISLKLIFFSLPKYDTSNSFFQLIIVKCFFYCLSIVVVYFLNKIIRLYDLIRYCETPNKSTQNGK